MKTGHVLGASEDMTVCHWYVSKLSAYSFPTTTISRDINSYTKANTTIEPISVYKGHTSVVGVRRHYPFLFNLSLYALSRT